MARILKRYCEDTFAARIDSKRRSFVLSFLEGESIRKLKFHFIRRFVEVIRKNWKLEVQLFERNIFFSNFVFVE